MHQDETDHPDLLLEHLGFSQVFRDEWGNSELLPTLVSITSGAR